MVVPFSTLNSWNLFPQQQRRNPAPPSSTIIAALASDPASLLLIPQFLPLSFSLLQRIFISAPTPNPDLVKTTSRSGLSSPRPGIDFFFSSICYITALLLPTDSTHFRFKAYMFDKANSVNKALDESILIKDPLMIHDVMRYSLLASGKRVRPILCIVSCELVGGHQSRVWTTMISVEGNRRRSRASNFKPSIWVTDLREENCFLFKSVNATKFY